MGVWLIERVTGRAFADVLSDEIWGRIGAEADGLVTVNSQGVAAAHGGIISTLRDVARFGLLFTPSRSTVASEQIVSADHLRKVRQGGRSYLLSDSDRASPGLLHSTYQWDQVWSDGSFFKSGFGGQGLYINPARDFVVAFFGTEASELASDSTVGAVRHPEDVCREM